MVKSYNTILKFKLIVKVLTLLFVFVVSNSWGQTAISNTNTAVVEAFTGYLGTSSLPANWTTSGTGTNGNSFQGTGQTTGTSGGWYGNGNMSYLGTGTASNGNATWKLQNTSCYTITSFTVSFVARMWKSGTSSPNCTITYSNNTTGTVPAAGALNAIGSFNDATGSISTGTTLTFVVSSISIPNNDYIYLRFINAGGSSGDNIGWDDISISVDGVYSCCTPPTTTVTPTSQTLCTGAVTTISVSSTATIPSYTWQASANGSSGWAAVASNTPVGASYSGQGTGTLSVTAGSTYYYQCLVTENGTCTATSATSTLVVNSSPTITSQPINKTICSGSNASFTVVSSGSPLTYQWQEKVGAGAFTNITNGGVYSGATSTTLLLTNPGTGMSTNQYQCVVSVASCSSVTTTAVVLTVNTTPTTTITPVTQTICVNATTTISVSSSASSPSYTWQASVNGTGSWANVINGTPPGITYSGTNTAILGITSSSVITYYYRCLIADGGVCTATSGTASVTFSGAPTITLQPTSAGTATNSSVTFSVGSSESGATYQWQQNFGSGFSNITNGGTNPTYAGATTTVLTITNPPASMNSYSYQCIVTGSCSAATSTTAVLTIFVTSTISCAYTGAMSIYDKCGPGQGCTAGCDLTSYNTFGYTMCNGIANTGNCPAGHQLQGIVIFLPAGCEVKMVAEFKPRTGCANSGMDSDDYLKINSTTYTATANSTISQTITQTGGSIFLEQKADRSEEILTFTTTVVSGSCPACSVLPIQLISFNCFGEEKGYRLNWATASEHNSKNFEIEYSSDGLNFEKVGMVMARGESNSLREYSYFVENNFNSDFVYFRLKMNDIDASSSYSPIIYVQNDIFSDFNITPNPTVNGYLTINFGKKLEGTLTNIELYDYTGKFVFEKKISNIHSSIDISHLENGIYVVNIVTPSKTKNFKIIISK